MSVPPVFGPQSERHRAIADDLAVDARGAAQNAHAAAQPLDDRLDLDDVARVDGAAVADALDAHEEDELLAVLRLRQDQDRADLRDRFREDCGREYRRLIRVVPEVALVERDILDADDPAIRLELGDAVHEQERIAVRQDAFDGGVIHVPDTLVFHTSGSLR